MAAEAFASGDIVTGSYCWATEGGKIVLRATKAVRCSEP